MENSRSKYRILSLIMTVLILIMSLPTYAFATIIDDEANKEIVTEETNEAYFPKSEVVVLEEDISLRDENIKHFKLSDGTTKAVSYATPVHYKDAEGNWIDIDNALSLNGSEYTANNKSEIKFANKSGSNGLVSIKDGEYKIDFTPLNTNKVSVEIENPQENNSRKFDDVKKLTNLISKATYKNIYDGIDLEYILISNNIKENIIVNQKQDTYSYSFEIKLNKLSAELIDNSIVLSDSDTGKQIYEIPAPYMLDANGEYSNDVEYSLTQNSKWKYTFTVSANAEWINDEKRAFPVTIDPTVGVESSVIADATEYSNTITSTGALKVGGGYKTQISFSSIPNLPKDAYLTDAILSLKHISGEETYVGSYQYNSNNISDFNNIVQNTTVNEEGEEVKDGTYGEDGWFSWNIYDIVYGWYNNNETKALELKATEGTNQIQFEATETSTINRPIIEISYCDMKGVESYWSYLTQNAGFAGSGAVNLATGNLMFEISTLTTTENIFGYTPSLIYNSAIAGEDYKYGSVQNGYWYSFAATGFKLNMNETLIKKSYLNGFGETEYYYVWADADGTEHYFLQSTKENEENIYYDEDGLQLKLVVDLVDDNEETYCKIVDSGFNERIFYILGGAPASEGLAVYHLEQLKDKNGNILHFIMDGAHKPNDIRFTPSGTTQKTQLLGPLYNSSGKVGLIWCNETKEGVLFRHSDTPTGTLNPTGGTYLREAIYLKCDSSVSWRTLINEFVSDTDNQADGITVCASAKYEYDSQGRLVSVYNELSEYTLMYFYDEAGRVEEVLEIGNENVYAENHAGQNIKISYFAGYTEVRTTGSDDVMGTEDDLINVYVFDNQGRAVTTYTTNAQRTEVYGAVSGEYVTDNENAKNSLKSTVSTGKVSPNYLLNGNFELSQSELAYWETEGNVAFTPNKNVTSSSIEWDDERLCLRVNGNETTSISQNVSLYPGNYTLSLDVLTYASKNLTINLKAIAQDSSGEENIEQIAVNETFASGSNNFASLSFKVEGTKGTRRPYKIVVSVTANADVVEESIFVDNLMLSKTTGAQEYSWVSNGSFDQLYTALESGVGVWNFENYSSVIHNNDEFNNYLKINGNISSERSISQTVYEVSEKTMKDFIDQYSAIGRCAETTFILSGFGKATEAMRNEKSKFSIIAEIYCYETIESNCQTIRRELEFNSTAQGWQFVSGMLTVPQYSFVKDIKVYCVYSNNLGEAYFDNIKLEICDYKTPRVVEYEYYEDTGKIMSENHGYDMVYYSYNSYGELTDTITENNYTHYEYDENHNVVVVKQYEFDGQLPYKSDYQTAFNEINVKKELVLTTNYQYNQFGLLEGTTSVNAKDSSTLTTQASYNTSITSKIFGSLETTTDALGNVTRYFYNQSNGRLIYEIGANNTGYYYTYDNAGNLISVQPATYSSSPSAVTGTTEIEYEYNEKYQLEKIVANGTEYNISYDIFGNQSSVSIGENQIVSQQYNAYNGKLANVTYANGTIVSYTYDKLERIEKITCTNGEVSYSYEYTYDSNGNVTKFVDGKNNKAIIYSYDLLGRLVKSVAHDTQSMVNESATQYIYDADNMLSNVWYTSDYTYNTTLSDVLMYNYGFAYSDENDAITIMGISFSDNEIAEITYNYDAWDRLATKNIAFSGVTNTINYTYKEQSTVVSEYITSVGSISKTYKYTYDDADLNITEIRDASNSLLQKYTYDSLDRLIREDNSQTGKTYVFTYDNNGNILSEKIYSFTTGSLSGITPTSISTYGYTNESWKDQLTSYNGGSIVYDSMGNPLTYWDGTSFTWDVEGNLASLNKGSISVSYKYDSSGIRTEKTVNGVTHHYTLDGTKILCEQYANVLLVYLYDEVGSPIGMAYRENSYARDVFDIYVFTKNLQGDIIDIYTEDGTIVASYTYDAWGNHTVINYTNDAIGTLNPFRYRGYYLDSGTGYYYLNSRYYDPQIKRFISADSVNYLGANGDLNSFNLYAYCSNNPVMRIDTMGTKWYNAFLELPITIFESVEAFAGVGFGVGVAAFELIELQAYRDSGITLNDGKFGAANSVVANAQLIGKIESSNVPITSVGVESLTHEGHYWYDNIFEQYAAELACEDCRVNDQFSLFIFRVNEEGDFLVGLNVSIHLIVGVSASVSLNLSEFRRNFLDDWGS